MNVLPRLRDALDRPLTRPLLARLATWRARRLSGQPVRIFHDGDWIHETPSGYYVSRRPWTRASLEPLLDEARRFFVPGSSPALGATVVDVGAGSGVETLLFSRLVGPAGRVVAIEAHPDSFRCLVKQLERNGAHNVTAVHAAIGSTLGRTHIEDGVSPGSNRIGAGRGFDVELTTLDSLLDGLSVDRVDLMTMNIEGAEQLALTAATEVLQRTQAICVCCHDFLAEVESAPALRTADDVTRTLLDAGFAVHSRIDVREPFLRDQVWGGRSTTKTT